MNLLAAISLNQCIGKKGKLPWCIPEELKLFKSITYNNVVIMGNTTFKYDLNNHPLPNRINIVFTNKVRLIEKQAKNLYFVSSRQQAFFIIHDIIEYDLNKVFVIGGLSIFSLFNTDIIEMRISHIKRIVEEGDTFFDCNWKNWNPATILNFDDFTHVVYKRNSKSIGTLDEIRNRFGTFNKSESGNNSTQ